MAESNINTTLKAFLGGQLVFLLYTQLERVLLNSIAANVGL